MADHDKPTVTSNYLDFVNEMHGRMDDLAVGFDPERTSATNVPNYSIRWSSVAKKWQYLDGSSWKDLANEYAINISGSAAKLKTARTITITGGGTAQPVQFDGSANIQLILESLDLDNLTGLGSAAGADVVQGPGNSEDDVMSQKATTDALSEKNNEGTGDSQTRINSQNDSRFARLSGGAAANFANMIRVSGKDVIAMGSNANGFWMELSIGIIFQVSAGFELTYQDSSLLLGQWAFPRQATGEFDIFYSAADSTTKGTNSSVLSPASTNATTNAGAQVVVRSQGASNRFSSGEKLVVTCLFVGTV